MTAAVVAMFLLVPQAGGPSQVELDAMKKLDFLLGKWEGSGWAMTGPTTKESYTGGETVQRKLQGRALLVEGLFVEPKTNKTIHETMAVITYDEKNKKYTFDTYLFNRPNAQFELKLLDRGFQWEMKPPGAPVTVRYTMNITDKGEWREIGEVLMEGRPPMQAMEMVLKKKT